MDDSTRPRVGEGRTLIEKPTREMTMATRNVLITGVSGIVGSSAYLLMRQFPEKYELYGMDGGEHYRSASWMHATSRCRKRTISSPTSPILTR